MTREQALKKFKVGTRVKRGPKWHWENQGDNTKGEITHVYGSSVLLMFRVKWDNGEVNGYGDSAVDYEDIALDSWEQGDI